MKHADEFEWYEAEDVAPEQAHRLDWDVTIVRPTFTSFTP